MSYDLQRKIWERGPRDRSQRTLLLAILFYRNRDSGLARPSIALLADRLGVTERHVHRVLRALADDGWIVVISGGGRHRTNHYRLCEDRLSTSGGNPDMGVTVSGQETLTSDPETLTWVSRNPDMGVTPTGGEQEKEQEGARREVPATPLPVIHEAPLPCPRHPDSWHHDQPCRRCRDLRIYDDQQRAAVANSTPTGPVCLGCGFREPQHDLAVERGTYDPHPFTTDPNPFTVDDQNGRASGAADERRTADPAHVDDDDLAAWIARECAGLRELHDRRYGT